VANNKDRPEPYDIIFQSLPQMIRESLTEEQTAALRDVLRDKPWNQHAIDMRVSVPIPYRPFYLTLVGDPERRSTERRNVERQKHPLLKLGNVVFIILAALLLYGVTIAATLLFSSIIE